MQRRTQTISVFGTLGLLLLVHASLVAEQRPLVGVPWQRHIIDNASRGADGVRLADANRDGLPDIATGWEQGGAVRVCLNPGPARVKDKWPAVTVGNVPGVEDAVLVDLDGDGLITPTGTGLKGSGDLYFYGDADPHYNFGVNLGAQWKGFDFSAFIQGVLKWNILRGGNGRAPFFRNYLNVNTTYVGKTWTPTSPDAQYPRLSFDSNINNWNWQFNDVNVQNLRYARLKALVVGYSLPKTVAGRIHAENVRFFFSGNDLFEITSVRDGFDPERGESSDSSYPFFRAWSFGLNLTF